MLSKRKSLLSLLIAMSLGGAAAADTLGVNAHAGAELRSQIESESRGMLASRRSLGARGIGQTELEAAIRADSEVSATTGSTQVGGSVGGEAEIDVDGQGSVQAESRRVTRRGAALGSGIDSELRGGIGADVADAMSAGVGAEIAGSIEAEVVGEVAHAIDAEVAGQVAQAINAEVVGEVAAAVAAEIEQTLASEVETAIEHEVQSSIDAELQTAVTGLVGR